MSNNKEFAREMVTKLGVLVENDFTILAVDFSTGNINVRIPAAKNGNGGNGLTEQEIGLCRQGRKIDAIKAVRERTGMGLADAKEFVERNYVFPPVY